MKQNPLAILFAGTEVLVSLLDKKKYVVHVRALPQRYLHHVLAACEWKHALVQLCTYLTGPESKRVPPGDYPDVPAPVGYSPVPSNWSDNLDDASIDRLYEEAKRLNFQRAADWARDQIVAKKLVAPLHEAAMSQVMPLMQQIMQPLLERIDALSNSTPNAPSSSAAPASNS